MPTSNSPESPGAALPDTDKTQKRRKRVGADEELRARIRGLLDKFEQNLSSERMTVSDYIRLLQVRRELEGEKPKDIVVRWVDALKEKNASEK